MANIIPGCVLWLGCLLAGHANDFAVESKMVQAPEMDPYVCYEILFQGQHYTVVPPIGWRAENDAASGILRFFDRRSTARVTMTFSSSNITEILAMTEKLRSYIVPDLAHAEVQGTFPVPVGGTSGKAIDLSWTFHGTAQRCRAAMVPLRKGNVSFVMMCENSGFKTAEQALNGLMITFQLSPATAKTSKL